MKQLPRARLSVLSFNRLTNMFMVLRLPRRTTDTRGLIVEKKGVELLAAAAALVLTTAELCGDGSRP